MVESEEREPDNAKEALKDTGLEESYGRGVECNEGERGISVSG